MLVFTDSQYCITVLSNTKKVFPKNMDLIERYRAIRVKNRVAVTFRFVRGHNGNKWNELCDQLCTDAMDVYLASHGTDTGDKEIDRLIDIYGW